MYVTSGKLHKSFNKNTSLYLLSKKGIWLSQRNNFCDNRKIEKYQDQKSKIKNQSFP